LIQRTRSRVARPPKVTYPSGPRACRDDVDAHQAHSDDVEAALTAYEQALFPRAAAAATEAARDFDLCFGENAPRSLIDLLTGVG
jgi:hypothetical protein